ncbi:uncharacterized protein LOC131659846 [Vicia villosa]|uniref:uncharacterized protein LOC131659846 n=1 Tax=Vicia villosa TaxID=3911 RepID=UPI00273C9794|nr:uncharacterized protein LOC131659846 [Vicia villosa]
MALEANSNMINMAPKATLIENIGQIGQPTALESRRLDCIYDDEPLGFEKDPGDGDFLGFVVHKKGIEINQNKTKAIWNTKAPTTKKELQSLLGKINFLRQFVSNMNGKTMAFSPLLYLGKESKFKWEHHHQEAFDFLKDYLMKPPMLAPSSRNKSMKLYISASESTLGSMLAQDDENGVERAIYYLSRVLNNVETRYIAIENMCLCLYFSCSKIKQYIKPVEVYVYSHFDVIKHMLSKPILHNQTGKWALALTKYSLTYVPLKAVKGQIVPDFIADHSVVDITEAYVGTRSWQLFFDGSRHKEGTGVGIFVVSPDGIPTKFRYRIKGDCSNNEAEYEALIIGLQIMLNVGIRDVDIKGDSELVVKQLTKEYKCVKENLVRYVATSLALVSKYDNTSIKHIRRVDNQEANDLG